MLSMSTRTHDYGRMTRDEAASGYYHNSWAAPSAEMADLNLQESSSEGSEESEEESEADAGED